MIQQPRSRSELSQGLDWATRISTIGLEFALPALLGYGLDRWWRTTPWMTVVGALLGMAIGTMHLLRLAQELAAKTARSKTDLPGGPRDAGARDQR